MPQISIIVPIYNVETYLRRCINSILAQTYSDFELILVDDGSLDGCGIICDEYSRRDKRVNVIHKKNGGLSDARNAGIEWAFANSNSRWLSFIDSDDWIHPRYLEELYNAAIKCGSSISICRYCETSEDLYVTKDNPIQVYTVNTEMFFCENNVNAIVAWGKLYKKELFISTRYPVGKIHEDEFVTYKILFLFDNISLVDAELYYYFKNTNSITSKKWSKNNINQLEAIKQSIKYLDNRYYLNACEKQIRKLYSCTYNQLKHINSHNYLALFKLKKYLKYVIKFGKSKGLYTYEYFPDLYKDAYPVTIRTYETLKKIYSLCLHVKK